MLCWELSILSMPLCMVAFSISVFHCLWGSALPKQKNVLLESRSGCSSGHNTSRSPSPPRGTDGPYLGIVCGSLTDCPVPGKWVYTKRDTGGHTSCSPHPLRCLLGIREPACRDVPWSLPIFMSIKGRTKTLSYKHQLLSSDALPCCCLSVHGI